MTRTCPRITETITYKRRKQDILASLPGEQVHYRLDSLTCSDCRHELERDRQFLCLLDKSECTFRQGQENRSHPALLQVPALQ